MERIERLNFQKGQLVNSEKKGKMEGLSAAFKKIKNSEKLTEYDTKCLAAFVDSFITVSTCEKIGR